MSVQYSFTPPSKIWQELIALSFLNPDCICTSVRTNSSDPVYNFIYTRQFNPLVWWQHNCILVFLGSSFHTLNNWDSHNINIHRNDYHHIIILNSYYLILFIFNFRLYHSSVGYRRWLSWPQESVEEAEWPSWSRYPWPVLVIT